MAHVILEAGPDCLVNILHQPIKRRIFLEEPRFRVIFRVNVFVPFGRVQYIDKVAVNCL